MDLPFDKIDWIKKEIEHDAKNDATDWNKAKTE